LHRLCPFYDKKWELLNGYAPGNPADPNNPLMPMNMYRTQDARRILFMNIYPRIRRAALAFLVYDDEATAIGSVMRKWDAFECGGASQSRRSPGYRRAQRTRVP
jgi:hypothetical protein